MLHGLHFSARPEALLNQRALTSGRRIGYFFAVLGIVSLAVAASLFSTERNFLVHAGRATARVVQIRTGRSGRGVTSQPVLSYLDGTGKEWRLVPNVGADTTALSLGQTTEVYYSPDDPGRGQLGGFFSRWGIALVLGTAGAVLTAVGYIGASVFEWLQRQPRRPERRDVNPAAT